MAKSKTDSSGKDGRRGKTGGRQPGSKNKLTTEVKELILAALDGVGGQAYLEEQARESPNAFLSLLGKVLPLQVTGADGGPIIVEVVKFADK